jgi:tetratricopeptide (TPR) repeat protein
MKKQILMSIAFLCFTLTAMAQTQAYTFLFPITYVDYDIALGQITVAESFNLQVGQTGKVIGLYNSENVGRNTKLGDIKIKDLDGITVSFDYFSDSDFEFFEGDLVAVQVELTKGLSDNLQFEMARLHIGLMDIQDEELNESELFATVYNETTEKEFFQKLLADIQFVATAMREQMASPMLESGRYEDTDLFTAMENSTWQDVRSFLRYVQARPTKYQGSTWKISEIYATWLNSGSPCTVDDLSELLLDASTADFKKYITGITESTMEECAEKWRNDAETFGENKDFDTAFKLANASLDLGEIIDNETVIAWSHYTKANLFDAEGNTDKAIENYEKSIIIFEKNENQAGILIAGNNMGSAYNNAGLYKKGLKQLEKSYDLHQSLHNESEVIKGVGALILRNQGDSYIGLENYKKAIKSYEEGLVLLEDATTQKYLTRKATIYYKLASTYEIIGNSTLMKENEEKAKVVINQMVESLMGN